MIEKSYEVSKKVYSNFISLEKGKDNLTSIGMNRTSANFYIKDYICLRKGINFHRTINADAMDYYLKNIYAENGDGALELALLSLSQHIAYYEDKSRTTAIKNREIYEKYTKFIAKSFIKLIYPDEIDSETEYTEGKTKKVLVNSYERNPIARMKCIEHYGLSCQVCKFNFESVFGELGKDFIHVHHIIELSTIGNEYSVDPLTDLIPVCPNCHSMLHKKKPAYSINELKILIKKNNPIKTY